MLEKIFFDLYLNYEIVKRPLVQCNTEIVKTHNCLGFPSGHAETSTIILCLLYFNKFITLPVCIIFIILFSLQRIIVNMHTLIQVIFGILFGFLYSQIYMQNHFSIYSFLIVFSIGFILHILSVYKMNLDN
jgi:hypothetical protein